MAVGVVLRYRRYRAVDALIVVAVPPLLLLPWSLDILAHPARLFLEAGLARPGLATAGLPVRSLLLLSPGGPGLPPYWVTAGLVLAATVAVVISGRRGLVLAGWAIGVSGLIIAAAVRRAWMPRSGPGRDPRSPSPRLACCSPWWPRATRYPACCGRAGGAAWPGWPCSALAPWSALLPCSPPPTG